jgi:IS5 family transposase
MDGQAWKNKHGLVFGLKLHLTIDRKGRIHGFKITPGNIHDAKAIESMMQHL